MRRRQDAERLVREGRLEAAVELCEGELLPGLDEEWVYDARESHRRRFGDVLECLAADAEAAGALEDAVRISRRRVGLDPLREDAHRQLMAPEPMAKPAVGAVLLHCGLVIAAVVYGLVGGYFHHNLWGGAGPGGAIQVNITSALPLPSDHPPNQNVLATEKPSEAPAPPQPKAKQAVDETAIPIQGKTKKPEHQEVKRTPPQQQPVPTNRAQYGEQAGSVMPRASTSGVANGPTTFDRRKFRQPLRMVRRQYQSQNGCQRISITGRSKHAQRREGVDRVPHSS